MKKKFKEWRNSAKSMPEFFDPGDKVDEELWLYVGEVTAPYFISSQFVQSGEADYIIDGTIYRTTIWRQTDDAFIFLGPVPEFKIDYYESQ